MHYVVAPNAFKGTLTAAEAAAALAAGIRDGGQTATECPVADGGDGTLDVLLTAHTRSRTETCPVTGPLGDPVAARLGWIGNTTAVVELAEAAGLAHVTHLRPLDTTTYGVGELIDHAISSGAQRIIVGVGGSASIDGGIGLLSALGAQFFDGDGNAVAAITRSVAWVRSATLEPALQRVASVTIDVAVDVTTILCGDAGAARIFGPQKGATREDVEYLDAGLASYAAIVEAAAGRSSLAQQPGSGAAGGAAFGLAAVGATLCPGAQLVCDSVSLDEALSAADVVVTGEGRLDAQTPRGKAPAEVAQRAHKRGIPCVAVAGIVDDALPGLFAQAYELGTAAGDRPAALAQLRTIGARLAASGIAPPEDAR